MQFPTVAFCMLLLLLINAGLTSFVAAYAHCRLPVVVFLSA
jgi:hypothetical protein